MFCCCPSKDVEAAASSAACPPPFLLDCAANFVLGAAYSQMDVPEALRGKPDAATAALCAAWCAERGAAGYFFQQHPGGHEVVGFFDSVESMRGARVRHGHERGWLAFAPPALPSGDDRAVAFDANFVPNAPYEQEDLPAAAKNQPLPVTLQWCAARGAERGAAGFFYQEHANGHEIVGFYASAAAAAASSPAWHGHARGFVVTPSAARRPAAGAATEAKGEAEPAAVPVVLDGVEVKERAEADDGEWVVVGRKVED